MFTFTSVSPGYRIFGEPVKSPKTGEITPEYDAKFIRSGAVGRFTTDNESIVEKLRKHPDFNKRFVEVALPGAANSNVVSGIRSSASHPEIQEVKSEVKPEVKVDFPKYIRFGVLQNKLLKNDQTYRKDASPEEIAEFELLKKELE